jgi:hypothetical protein
MKGYSNLLYQSQYQQKQVAPAHSCSQPGEAFKWVLKGKRAKTVAFVEQLGLTRKPCRRLLDHPPQVFVAREFLSSTGRWTMPQMEI